MVSPPSSHVVLVVAAPLRPRRSAKPARRHPSPAPDWLAPARAAALRAPPFQPRLTPVPGSRAREARSHCRRIGAPPRARQEGKLDLADAPRSPDRGGANSRRVPPAEPRTGRSGRRESGRPLARAEGVGFTSNPPDFRKILLLAVNVCHRAGRLRSVQPHRRASCPAGIQVILPREC